MASASSAPASQPMSTRPGSRPLDSASNAAMDRLLRHSLTNFPFELQARLFEAQSLHEIYEIGVAMLTRIPATIAVRIFQRDDTGEARVVHAWQSPYYAGQAALSDELGQAIHQRWIAAHRLGHGIKEFARPISVATCPSWLLMPMLVGDELIGAIAAERRNSEVFPYAPEDVVAMSAAAAGIAWAIHSMFLRERTDVLSDPAARAELLSRERRLIGRELHDTVVQDLAYVNLKLEVGEQLLPDELDAARVQFQAARAAMEHAIIELRRTIGELRRPAPARRGITGQLRSLVSSMQPEAPELDVNFLHISGVQLVPEVERAVVGIVREALQNVRKHSRAQSVKLEVRRAEDELRVYVSDDGVGMHGQPRVPGRESFGMDLMRELAEDLGGTLHVESDEGKGTQIQAYLPLVLPAEPADDGYDSRLASDIRVEQTASATSAGASSKNGRAHGPLGPRVAGQT
jgi:signal transduction histidine kinase